MSHCDVCQTPLQLHCDNHQTRPLKRGQKGQKNQDGSRKKFMIVCPPCAGKEPKVAVLMKTIEFGKGNVVIKSDLTTGVLTLAIIDGEIPTNPDKEMLERLLNRGDHYQLKFTNPMSIEKLIGHLKALQLGMTLYQKPELLAVAPVHKKNKADKNSRPANNKRKR